MDLQFVATLAGIPLAVIIGYLGIRYTKKYRSNAGLIFCEKACFSLFNNIVKNIDKLNISFNSEIISENMLLYKGTFINSGNVDIDKNNMVKPI